VAAEADVTGRAPYLGGWIELAVELGEENKLLRQLVLELAVALKREREAFSFAASEIAERFDGEPA
jgi:hypothetical protein